MRSQTSRIVATVAGAIFPACAFGDAIFLASPTEIVDFGPANVELSLLNDSNESWYFGGVGWTFEHGSLLSLESFDWNSETFGPAQEWEDQTAPNPEIAWAGIMGESPLLFPAHGSIVLGTMQVSATFPDNLELRLAEYFLIDDFFNDRLVDVGSTSITLSFGVPEPVSVAYLVLILVLLARLAQRSPRSVRRSAEPAACSLVVAR